METPYNCFTPQTRAAYNSHLRENNQTVVVYLYDSAVSDGILDDVRQLARDHPELVVIIVDVVIEELTCLCNGTWPPGCDRTSIFRIYVKGLLEEHKRILRKVDNLLEVVSDVDRLTRVHRKITDISKSEITVSRVKSKLYFATSYIVSDESSSDDSSLSSDESHQNSDSSQSEKSLSSVSSFQTDNPQSDENSSIDRFSRNDTDNSQPENSVRIYTNVRITHWYY